MRISFLFVLLLVSSSGTYVSANQNLSPETVVAKVNGQEIAAKALQLDFFLKQLSAANAPLSREQLIEQLIDRELMRQFLARRKIVADKILLEQQLSVIRRLVEMKGDDFNTVLQAAGLSVESLEQMLALQIAWKTYLTATLAESRIKEYWTAHKPFFDGTQVTASQIFLNLNGDDPSTSRNMLEQQLSLLRSQILNEELSFADAARKYSQSPSATKGGDLGTFEGFGSVADEIARQALQLQPGEISQPFQSSLGMHLVYVRDRQPGERSLEDARPKVVERLSALLWEEQVARERKTARIQIIK